MTYRLSASVFAACAGSVLVAACSSTQEMPLPAEGTGGDDFGQIESELTSSYSDGTGSYRYVDTHDDYGHTGVVDQTEFMYFRRVRGKQAIGLTMDCAWVEPANAIEVLDVLKRYNVKISFFISGPFIFSEPRKGLAGGLDRKNFAVIRRMIEEGHEFGNHTQTHPHNNQSINWGRENDELRRGWDAVVATLYPSSTAPENAKMLNFWRAPYCEYDARALGLAAKAGFPYHFGWNVDVKDATDRPSCATSPNDAKCLSASKLTDNVLGFAEKNRWSLDGFVILSHLQNPYHWGASAQGLERLLVTATQKNHVIARISEMFIEAPSAAPGGGSGGSSTSGPAVAGERCAPGCIFSAFCVDRNASAVRYPSASGAQLICVKVGDCDSECAKR
jgi:peptidoglycan/xylan/chitin deacetylase (PgdA/CDA1 family)